MDELTMDTLSKRCPQCGLTNPYGVLRCDRCGYRFDAMEPPLSDFPAGFVSGHSRAQWVTILLAITVVLSLIAAVSDYLEITLLSSIKAGRTITEAEAAANDSRQQIIGGFQLLAFLAIAVLFLMWIHRAYRNLAALGAKDLQFTSGWAVGWFFVPVMNFFRPFQVVREIWKTSDPSFEITDGSLRNTLRTSPLIKWWWAFWIMGGYVTNKSLFLSIRAETVDELLTVSGAYLVSNILTIFGGVLAIFLVRAIDERQEKKGTQVKKRNMSSAQRL